MKTRISIFLLFMAIFASAQDTTRAFSLNGGLAFDNYGYLANSTTPTSTEYAGLRITPDWRFARHWGVRLDVGAGWAFASNTTGIWEKPMHSITSISLAVAPYYEFIIRQWYVDLALLAGCRYRMPYMNGEFSKYLQTLTVGVGADVRFGYMFTRNWGVFANLQAERTVYDLLYDAFYSTRSKPAGCIGASVGVTYRF